MSTYFPALALIDCGSFYASCERVFQPRFMRQPLVVLSNNDGCVIARSSEAKLAGVRMGVAAFESREVFERCGVVARSSNYTLYGDMSARVMRVLGEWTPEVEVYSIDEAFVNLAACPRASAAGWDYERTGREMQEAVRRWTGIPVAVGIAETKTLAKIATRLAKRSEKTRGVLNLFGSPYMRLALERTPVDEVWGIGGRWGAMLLAAGVRTALDLRECDDAWVRGRMGVVGLRTVRELRGVSCLPLEFAPPPKNSLTVSRSFGSQVESLGEMREAVAHFAARAAEKLRREGMIAGVVTIFLQTNRFSDAPQYASSATVHLPVPTDFTPEIVRAAHRAVDRVFAEGYSYKKAGVMLLDLVPAERAQGNLYHARDETSENRLMQTIDRINRRHGREAVRYLGSGLRRRWRTRAEHLSPRYTTHWNEIPVVGGSKLDVIAEQVNYSSAETDGGDGSKPRDEHRTEPRRVIVPPLDARFVVH